MKYFKLPDLGEGLPDAEIREWYVKAGDHIRTDDPLVAMETAKAVVDVPSPFTGVIETLHGKVGDTIRVGSVLVSFEGEDTSNREDEGTVVGKLESTGGVVAETSRVIKSGARTSDSFKATPAVKALAQRLGVDLTHLRGTGPQGLITVQDVKQAQSTAAIPQGYEPLKGSRRMMMKSMTESHEQVCPVTIFDEVDLSAWSQDEDISVRLLRALIKACQAEPALNASFDGHSGSRKFNTQVNLGIAVDSPEGLFVPVIHDADKLLNDPQALRARINQFKTQVRDRSIEPHLLSGATITLSNFGNFAGRFATPIVVPPQVAILASGALREGVLVKNGQPCVTKLMPLSLSFDHRAVTGGEATRFMAALIGDLKEGIPS